MGICAHSVVRMTKKIFLFPGQGSQTVGMGKDFYENFSLVKQTFEEAQDVLKIKLYKLCFEGPENELKLTANTQPAILMTSYAIYRVLTQETGLRADLLAGHSLGEYTALVVSGALKFSDAISLVHVRGQAMQQAVPLDKGAMVALMGIEAKEAIELCREVSTQENIVSPANFNGGGQVVVSGTASAVKKLVELIERSHSEKIRKAVPLDVSAPFHCHLMMPAAKKMESVLEKISFSKVQISYIANVDAALYQGEGVPIRKLLVEQIPNPVQWEESMKSLQKYDIEEAFEIGPGKVLTRLLRRINKDIKTYNIQRVEDLKLF